MRTTPFIAVLAFAAAPVLAQNTTPAPSAAPATPAADVPKHNCTKPGEFPTSLSSDTQKRTFQKDYVAYTECLKKFALDQQRLAEPHTKAANDAATEYNAAVKTFNEAVEKANSNK